MVKYVACNFVQLYKNLSKDLKGRCLEIRYENSTCFLAESLGSKEG
jgi:hypothetical protein